jgi:hypothetical protein
MSSENLPEESEEPIDPSVSSPDAEGSSSLDQDGEFVVPPPDYGDGLPPELLWIKEGENKVLVTIYAYKDPQTNRLRIVAPEIRPVMREAGMIEYPIESEWSVPTREQINGYRERATRVDQRSGQVMLHQATIQNLIIQHHLLDLKFPASNGSISLELTRDSRGALTKKAMTRLGQLHTTVLEMLYLKYSRESTLAI